MIGTILVALDGSARAPRVLAVASEIAARFRARMILFRAIHVPAELPPAAHVETKDWLDEYLRKEAHDEVMRLADGLLHSGVEQVVVAVGEPWRAIIDASDRYTADLIVMGSHGFGVLDLVLGTTAARVANHATRNVFIVHTKDAR